MKDENYTVSVWRSNPQFVNGGYEKIHRGTLKELCEQFDIKARTIESLLKKANSRKCVYGGKTYSLIPS